VCLEIPCRLSHVIIFEPKSLIESIDESTGEVACRPVGPDSALRIRKSARYVQRGVCLGRGVRAW